MKVRINGTDIFCVCRGQGQPLLLMHGGLGWDHTYLRAGLDGLADGMELIYYDHRGNGRSDRPVDWQEVTHATWVEDAESLRAELGHERVVLFGHSYGGFLAQEYALRYPQRVDGLILCCTAPALDYPEVIVANAQARGTPEQVQAILEALSGTIAEDRTLERLMDSILSVYFHASVPTRARGMFRQTHYSAAAFNHAFSRCAPTFNTVGRLPQLGTATLVLGARSDWIMPPVHGAERLHAALPASELVIFERSGHFPWIEEPERFRAVLEDWLSRRVEPAAG